MEIPTKRYRPKRDNVDDVDDSRGRRHDRSPSFKRCRRSKSWSTPRSKSSREREYQRESTESSNNTANSNYSPQVSYNTDQRTVPSDTNQRAYPMQYGAQDSDYYNYNYSKTSRNNGHQQAAEYGNKGHDLEVDEELMREIKEIFSDVDDDEHEKPPLPETTSISAATYERTSPSTFEDQRMPRASPYEDRISRSKSPPKLPESLHLKIQSQLTRLKKMKLLQKRIQSRNESLYLALIQNWKLDVEEVYNLFKMEHEFLKINCPASLTDHEYFSNGTYKEMFTVYSSIMVTLADMEKEILKTIEQDELNSSRRMLLTNHLNQLDDIPPQTRSDPSSLDIIATSFTKLRKEIHSLVPKEYVGDCLLMHRMTQLLDKPTREAWHDWLGSCKKCPTFEEFSNFLAKRVRALEGIDLVSSTTKDIADSTPAKRRLSVLERIGSSSRLLTKDF
ncbi:hypothetical protein TSAR_013784 [Trichomalopsis sarcophagae]|uniref:Uncharacterized protein n=1 Tax=Trichomalopsis sarcophagae TaxID=543379 RepID=A0A232F3K5_9HYME|nr:hypothetical protein TSAR_013784 [Trichomalopsis sarcophagae]